MRKIREEESFFLLFLILIYNKNTEEENMELIRDLFKNTNEYDQKTVKVAGWIRNNRSQKEYGFIDLNGRPLIVFTLFGIVFNVS